MTWLLCFFFGHSDGYVRERVAWRCVRCKARMGIS